MDTLTQLRVGEKDDLQKSIKCYMNQEYRQSLTILYTLPNDNREILFWRGLNYIKLEDYNALNNIIQMEILPIDCIEHKFLKGVLLFFIGEQEESVYMLESIKMQISKLVLMDTVVIFEFFLNLGMGYQAIHLYGDAIEYYKIYLTYNMKSEATMTNLFQCYIKIKDKKKAKHTYYQLKQLFSPVDDNYFIEQLNYIS